MKTTTRGLLTFATAFFAAPTLAQTSTSEKRDLALEEVVVTGVMQRTTLEDAPISISVLNDEQIRSVASYSTPDILKSVPGVYVISTQGETRNVVFSRGVSANAQEPAYGYFYVSLQEDGLPVTNVTQNNNGPDYYTRADLMLKRVEALRGGTAMITGPNAPGGIFNYISRTGESDPGTEVSVRMGLEGDGENSYRRMDMYHGGQIGNSKLYYAVGGFYRESVGDQDAGYDFNFGGQLRANLLYDYDDGSLLLNVKHLDDHNDFTGLGSFARDFEDPRIVSDVQFYPSPSPHSYVSPQGDVRHWDASDLIHNKSDVVDLKWQHGVDGGWRIQNRARYSDNRSIWNTGSVNVPMALNDPLLYLLANVPVSDGTVTFRDRSSGAVAAQVGFTSCANPFAPSCSRTILANNLPNQGLVPNALDIHSLLDTDYSVREFTDQLTVGKSFGDHSLTLGGYYARSKVSTKTYGAGFGFAGLLPYPVPYDVTLVVPAGTVYQVTDPSGYTSLGNWLSGGAESFGTQEMYSAFFGDTWTPTDTLTIDGGMRYENLQYDITNSTIAGRSPFASTGADGNPLTLYDNAPNTITGYLPVSRDFSYVAYSGAVTYEFSDTFQSYIRASRGKKAPDFRVIGSINTPQQIANNFPESQLIEQVELGLKYNNSRMRIAGYPFWSRLSNVLTIQLFTDETGRSYVPSPQGYSIETFGVELESSIQFNSLFELRSAITLQRPKASAFTLWNQGPTLSRSDDFLVTTPSGDAEANPKIMAQNTLTITPSRSFSGLVTWNYVGSRAANYWNTWYMPAYSTVDLAAIVNVSDKLRIQANINNVFNEIGIVGWNQYGGFLQTLDRQSFTPADRAADPDRLFGVNRAPLRAYFLTASYSF